MRGLCPSGRGGSNPLLRTVADGRYTIHMTIIFWILVFIVSLALMVKSADWLLQSSEKIGLAIGLTPFIIGVTIVAFGTSFPELISSIAAVIQDVPEIVTANAIGSNIANIFLVVGFAAVFGKKLVVSKSLIDLDLPLLALSTAIFMVMAWDGMVTIPEAIFLLLTYGVYLAFSVVYKQDTDKKEPIDKPKITDRDILLLFIGIIGLALGAKYLIDSIVSLSTLLNIGTSVIAITAVAVGTSLPELLVSVKAAKSGKSEVALGNVFGSNVFNPLVVVGIPGIFANLPVSEATMAIGFPFLILATIIFVISGISKRVHFQEGVLYLLLYILFIIKLFEVF